MYSMSGLVMYEVFVANEVLRVGFLPWSWNIRLLRNICDVPAKLCDGMTKGP